MRRFILLTICILILASKCHSQNWLTYLNKLRTLTGLKAFQENQLIDKAARNHAVYLAKNQVIDHYENPYNPFYTGTTPADRLRYVGYNYLTVGENISYGEDNATSSIDDLFSAIYHRLAFLEPSFVHIGFGQSKDLEGSAYYVFDMASPASLGYSGYISLLKNSPEIVIWPANNVVVPPVFYNTEEPNPLPNMLITGYPISFSFNKLLVNKVELIDFELTDQSGKSIDTIEMTSYSDPNGELSQNQFVFFPINRLNWATTYKAKATFKVNDNIKTYTLIFKTRKPPYPMYIIDTEALDLPIVSGKTYTLYFPPTTPQDTISHIRYSYTYGTAVDINLYDPNTLNIKATGLLGSEIFIKTPYRSVTLTISNNDYATSFENNTQSTSKNNLLPPPTSQEVTYVKDPSKAPVKINNGLMYVDLHYTATVNMIIGVFSCDLSQLYTLGPDCQLHDSPIYIQTSELQCTSVPVPLSGGFAFWLVTGVPLENFDLKYSPYSFSFYQFGFCP